MEPAHSLASTTSHQRHFQFDCPGIGTDDWDWFVELHWKSDLCAWRPEPNSDADPEAGVKEHKDSLSFQGSVVRSDVRVIARGGSRHHRQGRRHRKFRLRGAVGQQRILVAAPNTFARVNKYRILDR